MNENIQVFHMTVSMLRDTFPETLKDIAMLNPDRGNYLRRRLHAILKSVGIEGDGRHEALTKLFNRPIDSANDLALGELLALFSEDDLIGLLDAIDQLGSTT